MCGSGGVTGRPGDPGDGASSWPGPAQIPREPGWRPRVPCPRVQSGLLVRPGGARGDCSSGSSPWRARLGSEEDADSALESWRQRSRSGPGEAGGPGRARAAVRWSPGGLLGEPRGLVSGLHRGERGRLMAQALGGFFQSQFPNWVRSGRQSGSLGASN